MNVCFETKENCLNYAWPKIAPAIQQVKEEDAVLTWAGKQYADLGFFADAVEVLADVCSRFAGPSNAYARRLLAEVRWRRDNAYRIPWVPPLGDGSRYTRVMKTIDPTAPTQEQMVAFMRKRLKEVGNAPTWQPVISAEMAQLIESHLPSDSPQKQPRHLVDWSILDTDLGAGCETGLVAPIT
jgi:hypothetical protein